MKELIEFLEKSFTCYHAIQNLEEKLVAGKFLKLEEDKKWQLEAGKNYYVIRNASSLIAFKVPNKDVTGFHIVASHSDSPSYKLKPKPTIKDGRTSYIKLNTEGYGGMIDYSWLDRPLGIAGRVFIDEGLTIQEKLVNFNETIVIPSLAIHLNRAQENKFNPQIDMLPLLGSNDKSFEDVLGQYVPIDKVLSTELFLYNKEKAELVGANKEYLLAPRLDDLECAYLSIDSLMKADNQNIAMSVILNNEEVGSGSANAANSSFVFDVIKRIAKSLALDYQQLLANSLLVSADNAHAEHPNHQEKADATHVVLMNQGIVIKHQAALRYTTDGLSAAIFKKMCNDIDVKWQDYTNRSDQRGGSTLGAILQSHVSIPCVDLGLPQLAMHSTMELTGVKDIDYMRKALQKYYEMKLKITGNLITIQ